MPEARQALVALSNDIRRGFDVTRKPGAIVVHHNQAADEAAEALYYRIMHQVDWGRVTLEAMQIHEHKFQDPDCHDHDRETWFGQLKAICGRCVREAALNTISFYGESDPGSRQKELKPRINQYQWAIHILDPERPVITTDQNRLRDDVRYP